MTTFGHVIENDKIYSIIQYYKKDGGMSEGEDREKGIDQSSPNKRNNKDHPGEIKRTTMETKKSLRGTRIKKKGEVKVKGGRS